MSAKKHSDPGWLHRPPKIHPSVAFTIAFLCIPVGILIKGGIGGGLVGGGAVLLLAALWDAFRFKVGMVHKPRGGTPDHENGT